jgi:hypothetical protein
LDDAADQQLSRGRETRGKLGETLAMQGMNKTGNEWLQQLLKPKIKRDPNKKERTLGIKP